MQILHIPQTILWLTVNKQQHPSLLGEYSNVFSATQPCVLWPTVVTFTIINRADNSPPSHAAGTVEYTGTTTTVSKFHYVRLVAVIDFFSPFVCFVPPPPPPPSQKSTVYFISLATKACDQSFIIYNAAKGLGPIKADICITQGLS